MGWLRSVRTGVPFLTAPSPLFDPLCLAAFNTGSVRVRVTGSGPMKGMLVLSAASQRGPSNGLGAVTKGSYCART
eukprot:365303-Chlamydomonas_euryale.AAC.7